MTDDRMAPPFPPDAESYSKTAPLNRWILWLALAGMILALHLWIQKARGFDQGCLGLEKPIHAAGNGCREVGDLPASHLLGVSNAAWGYAFYFGLALLSFAKLVVRPDWARRLHRLGTASVAAALLYSFYLVGVMVLVAKAYCLLCLASAILIAVLFALHLMLWRRGGFKPVPPETRGLELGIAVGGLFAAMGLLFMVVLFINRVGTRPLNQGETARELESVIGASLPAFIDQEKLTEMAACHFDWWTPPLDMKTVIRPETPSIGRGGVQVVVFMDPNCSFCARHFAEFRHMASQLGDRATFHVVPRILWPKSELLVQALKLAESSDRYFDLWERMLASQSQQTTTLREIETMFRELGIPADNLERRLADVRPEVLQETARLKNAGVSSLPSTYIDGRKTANINQGEACVEKLILRVTTERPAGGTRR